MIISAQFPRLCCKITIIPANDKENGVKKVMKLPFLLRERTAFSTRKSSFFYEIKPFFLPEDIIAPSFQVTDVTM